MKLDVSSLESGAAPVIESFEAGPAWWQERRLEAEPSYAVVGPVRFELKASKVRSQLHLAGEFRAEIECECSRCLARYRQPLRDDFRLVLDDAGERVPAEPESAEALHEDGLCLGDEIEAGLYRGTELRLDRFFAELVSAALPLQPVCREDCAGLCPHCGADLNEGRCGCRDEERESPFAVLKNLQVTR